jgi:phenylacetate-coenzyme A ligase PaaK-like adenylate-forming protein
MSEHADNIEAAVRKHAERIMNAAGSSLRNYSVYGSQERILAAVIDCYEEAYRAGADLALKQGQHSPAKDD